MILLEEGEQQHGCLQTKSYEYELKKSYVHKTISFELKFGLVKWHFNVASFNIIPSL